MSESAHSPASAGDDEILSAGPSPEEEHSPLDEGTRSSKKQKRNNRPQKGLSPPKKTWACGGADKTSAAFQKALCGEKWEHVSITEPTKTAYSTGYSTHCCILTQPNKRSLRASSHAAPPSVVLVLHSYKNAVRMLQDFYGTSDKCREGILPMVAFK